MFGWKSTGEMTKLVMDPQHLFMPMTRKFYAWIVLVRPNNTEEKAIAMCLARFDDDTREAFLSLYGKVDADSEVGADSSKVSADPEAEDTKCPF